MLGVRVILFLAALSTIVLVIAHSRSCTFTFFFSRPLVSPLCYNWLIKDVKESHCDQLRLTISVAFRIWQSDIHTHFTLRMFRCVEVIKYAGFDPLFLLKPFCHSLHNHFCHFWYLQTSATLWMSEKVRCYPHIYMIITSCFSQR